MAIKFPMSSKPAQVPEVSWTMVLGTIGGLGTAN